MSFQPRGGICDGSVADLPRPRWAVIEPGLCVPAGIDACATRERLKPSARSAIEAAVTHSGTRHV
jgi:hypothetical protein